MDFTYVEDLVDGLFRAGYFESAIGQEFNLTFRKKGQGHQSGEHD